MAGTRAEMDDFEVVSNKRAKAPIWTYFGLKKLKSSPKPIENIAICRRCNAMCKYSGGTTNLSSHMRRHHPGVLSSSPVLQVQKSEERETISSPKVIPAKQVTQTLSHMFMPSNMKTYPSNSHRAQILNDKVARFIVKGLRPYSIVDSSEFIDLVETLDPKYKCPKRTTFAERIIPNMYREVKAGVQSQLIQADQVALTCDGWTSCATDSYMTVTSCHLSVNWELINYVLQTRQLNESHTAECISNVLEEAVEEWRIPSSLLGKPPLTTDNAANVVKAASIFGSILHVPCLAHTINLAVQKALKVKRVSHVLSKIRQTVAFFHRSPLASSMLKDKAALLNLPDHELIIDVATRWNSAYDMVSRFLEMQCAVITVLMTKDVAKCKGGIQGSLTDDETRLAEDVIQCLKPMKDITTMLCREDSPTVSIVMPVKHHLLDRILLRSDDDTAAIRELKQIMAADLKPRYTSKDDMLNVTSAVDPRFKDLPWLTGEQKFEVYGRLTTETARLLEKSHEKVAVKTEPGTESASTEPALPNLVLPENDEEQGVNSLSSTPVKVEDSAKKDSKPKSLLEDVLGDVFIVKTRPAKSPFELAQQDVTAYQNEPMLSLSENPLSWWRDHEFIYPNLARLAKMLLCIPATSVPSERAFSTAGDIISHQRASLKPQNVDMLLFLKKNLK